MRYYKGDVVMAKARRNYWKDTLVKVNKYNSLHKFDLLEIRYDISKKCICTKIIHENHLSV